MIVAPLLKNKSLYTMRDRQDLIRNLYEQAFPAVARFVSQKNGSLQDAKDVFQDALIIFYEKLLNDPVAIVSSNEAYVIGISRHLWFRKFNQEQITVDLDDEQAVSIPDDHDFSYKEPHKLISFLEHSGKKCMELLRAFYYDKQSMENIRQKLGYNTAHAATVQKFKCLEKIRNEVKEKHIAYEDFSE